MKTAIAILMIMKAFAVRSGLSQLASTTQLISTNQVMRKIIKASQISLLCLRLPKSSGGNA
jgi:hypothetical protein